MKNPEKELAEIKSMMERSTRFLSLSGLSGILAGCYALLASAWAYYWLYYPHAPIGWPISGIDEGSTLYLLGFTAMIVLAGSIMTAWALSQRKSKRTTSRLWTPAGKRFVSALFTPVLTGGLFCLALLSHGYLTLLAPTTLIFYGLALLNASQFTHSDIKYLGYFQVVLGLASVFFPGYGLVCWALGFGVLHIVYGTVMHFKYDR